MKPDAEVNFGRSSVETVTSPDRVEIAVSLWLNRDLWDWNDSPDLMERFPPRVVLSTTGRGRAKVASVALKDLVEA